MTITNRGNTLDVDPDAMLRAMKLRQLLEHGVGGALDARSIGTVLGLLEGLASDTRSLFIMFRDDGATMDIKEPGDAVSFKGRDLIDVLIQVLTATDEPH